MEKKIFGISGLFGVFIQICLIVGNSYFVFSNLEKFSELGKALKLGQIDEVGVVAVMCVLFPIFLVLILFKGYIILDPNEAAIVSFMGKYKGTLKRNGFSFINPFYGSVKWSLKVSNHKTAVLKVNEKEGIPIEISATIEWKISDTYKAKYEVEDVNDYIHNQFEISLRKFAQSHQYKQLSGQGLEFIDDLKEKVSKAGIEILDAKVTHLNYAAEIAGSMLQKQQASSLSDAKEIIVSTAVHIAKKAAAEIGEMNQEQKVKFISNLIVVLCSEKSASPVINI